MYSENKILALLNRIPIKKESWLNDIRDQSYVL